MYGVDSGHRRCWHRAGPTALFSSNISRCLGVQVAKITYARGFCAKFATFIVVVLAFRNGESTMLQQPLHISLVGTRLWIQPHAS
jgi:phosphate/sulfate permease